MQPEIIGWWPDNKAIEMSDLTLNQRRGKRRKEQKEKKNTKP